jgi:predicted Fe-Mo cluster-binding NifX family protein
MSADQPSVRITHAPESSRPDQAQGLPSPVIVCVPVTGGGVIDPRWGRADRLAIAEVEGGEVLRWREFDVGWSQLHDEGTPGAHHARVARLLREHGVNAVVADHMGDGMVHMLQRLGVRTYLGASGDARSAVLDTCR